MGMVGQGGEADLNVVARHFEFNQECRGSESGGDGVETHSGNGVATQVETAERAEEVEALMGEELATLVAQIIVRQIQRLHHIRS